MPRHSILFLLFVVIVVSFVVFAVKFLFVCLVHFEHLVVPDSFDESKGIKDIFFFWCFPLLLFVLIVLLRNNSSFLW